MITTDCITRDNDQVLIKQRWSELFNEHNLLTFDQIKQHFFQKIAKATRTDRITTHCILQDKSHKQTTFYLKWHGPPPLKDYIKPLLQLKLPILGALNEWHAMHWLRDAGVPSMEPVAFGKSGTESFVISRGIEGGTKLSEWITHEHDPLLIETVTTDLAAIIQHMHETGYYHQDLYLGHVLLVPDSQDRSGIWRPWELNKEHIAGLHPFNLYLLDLGRVIKPSILKKRWKIKDLAQLLYSAKGLPRTIHTKFMRTYFQSDELQPEHKRLIRQIQHKANRIARHTLKKHL